MLQMWEETRPSRFDMLKVPSLSRDWIVTTGCTGLAMAKFFLFHAYRRRVLPYDGGTALLGRRM
jgi:hypothetical protein